MAEYYYTDYCDVCGRELTITCDVDGHCDPGQVACDCGAVSCYDGNGEIIEVITKGGK